MYTTGIFNCSESEPWTVWRIKVFRIRSPDRAAVYDLLS